MPRRKGKGIEAFLGEEEPQGKATFYLPPKLLLELDDVWLELRRENRKLRKSDIVAWALSQALKVYQEKGKESELYRALVPKEQGWPGNL